MKAAGRAQKRTSDAGASRVQTLADLSGIPPEILRSMHEAGIFTIESLIASANSPRLRMFLAARTGLTARQILDVLDLADLARVPSITQEIALLLRTFGIRNVSDLAAADMEEILGLLSSDDNTPDEQVLEMEGLLGILIAQARLLPRRPY